jgi:hypothetical protein
MRNKVDLPQKELLRRVQLAGCPVSYDHLLGLYPLRITTKVPDCGKGIFALQSGGTGIAIWAQIVATSRITFQSQSFGLRRTNGQEIPVSWVPYCDTHGCYCLHDTVEGELCFQTPAILNELDLRIRVLKNNLDPNVPPTLNSGDNLEGYLVGITPEHLLVASATEFEALLVFKDNSGDEYPIPISMKC